MRVLGIIIIAGLFYGCSAPVKEAETAYTSELKELIPLMKAFSQIRICNTG